MFHKEMNGIGLNMMWDGISAGQHQGADYRQKRFGTEQKQSNSKIKI